MDEFFAIIDKLVRLAGAIACGTIAFYSTGILISLIVALAALSSGDCDRYIEVYYSDVNIFAEELKQVGLTARCDLTQAQLTERNVLIFADILICTVVHALGAYSATAKRWDISTVFLTIWLIYFVFSILVNFLVYSFPAETAKYIPVVPVSMTATKYLGISAFGSIFWTVDRRSSLLDLVRRMIHG